MKLPTTEQLDQAIAWLRVNEGEAGEAEACRAAADYLEHMDNERLIRESARSAGVTKATFRRRLKERTGR